MPPEEPRKGSWLILRYLYHTGQPANPGSMLKAFNIRVESPPSESTLTRALSALKERDLVVELSKGSYYVLTEAGVKFVEDELDSKPLPGPRLLTESDVPDRLL